MGYCHNIFSSCSHSDSGRILVANNPDPEQFEIKKIIQEGKFVITLINYPNCTNYEGNKVLVFYDTTVEEVMKASRIDPHFCENCKLSPIARFEPTKRGLNWAAKFVRN